MEFYDVINKRSSVRGYKKDAISNKVLERIADAVNKAPSACNIQPVKFKIILDVELQNKICKCYKKDFLKDAPAIVVALGNKEKAWKRFEGTSIVDIDMGIAMEHLVLSATAEGLSTCWICAYEMKALNKVMNVEKNWDVLAISPLGYTSDKNQTNPPKKDIKDIFEIV